MKYIEAEKKKKKKSMLRDERHWILHMYTNAAMSHGYTHLVTSCYLCIEVRQGPGLGMYQTNSGASFTLVI